MQEQKVGVTLGDLREFARDSLPRMRAAATEPNEQARIIALKEALAVILLGEARGIARAAKLAPAVELPGELSQLPRVDARTHAQIAVKMVERGLEMLNLPGAANDWRSVVMYTRQMVEARRHVQAAMHLSAMEDAAKYA